LVIVGRPNVGKSTLFNRITASRRAIVGNQPGITRDRIQLEAVWKSRRFEVIDTGGMLLGEPDEFPELINQQVRVALETASQVVFLTDGRSEITATDRDLADLLRRLKRPLTLAVNKCDTAKTEALAAAFYELGISDVFPISAEHGLGVDALLDHVTAAFPIEAPPEGDERPIRVAIIGRPNVGKSTLLNRLTGKERAIVSPTPGTTRDAVDEEVTRRGTRFQFVDTAGIRRKGKTREMAEKLSVVMAQRHIRLADVALLLLDASDEVAALDANIAGYAHEAGKALILVVNKWDRAHEPNRKAFAQKVRDKLKFLEYAPLHFTSALDGKGVQQIFSLVRRVHQAANHRVPTGELNRFLDSVDLDRATVPGGRLPRINYVTQAGVAPPTFVFFTTPARKFHFSFERFLVNQLREAFPFEGTPLVVKSGRSKKKRR
jgi:GTP-binding protein